MKTATFKRFVQLLLTVGLTSSGVAVYAAATWNGTAFSCGDVSPTSTWGNTASVKEGSNCTGATVVSASAWSSTPGSTNSTFEVAQLKIYDGGFGVSNKDEGLNAASDSHTIDNSAAVDLVAFDFGSKSVSLSTASVGWISGANGHQDSDISVFAWTGTTAPQQPSSVAAAVNGKTVAGLAAANSGWTLVGSYADLTLNTPKAVNASGTNSSWWLISAYSQSYDNNGWSATNDYFKLSAITGSTTTTKVPEPGSIALLGLGLVGMVAARRRKQVSM